MQKVSRLLLKFQHTAARGRLGPVHRVSLTSRCSFNTQPPEGGWKQISLLSKDIGEFQHTAARGRLGLSYAMACLEAQFQHTAARGRLGNQ